MDEGSLHLTLDAQSISTTTTVSLACKGKQPDRVQSSARGQLGPGHTVGVLWVVSVLTSHLRHGIACGEGKRIWVGACSWWVGSFILNSDVVASDEDRTGYNW